MAQNARIIGKIQNANKARAAFKALPEVVRDKIGKVNQLTGFSMQQRAKANVPVLHGFLKNHISMTFSQRSGLARVGVAKGRIVIPGKGGSALTKLGASVHEPSKYGRMVNFGTSRTTAQPFMTNAARAEQQPHLDRIRREGPAIEAAAKAIADAASGD